MSVGIVYVATGETYRRECRISAESVKVQMPNIPITVFSDAAIHSEHIDHNAIIPNPRGDGSHDVISCLGKSPYERTIYLDTDIYLDADISEVFQMLDRFDLCLVMDPSHVRSRESPLGIVPDGVPEYNTGFIAYRQTKAVEDLLVGWLRLFEYHSDTIVDQPSFRTALYLSTVEMLVLPPQYNCLYSHYPGYLYGRVKVFHGRLLETDGQKGLTYRYDPAKGRSILNESCEARVYTHSRGLRIDTDNPTDVGRIRRLYYRTQRDGIVSTIRVVGEYLTTSTVGRLRTRLLRG